MRLLVTGGAGYIGSHTCIALLEAGHDVVALDDFSNSDRGILDTVMDLAGRKLKWIEADIRDRSPVKAALRQGTFDAILHLAALKSAQESFRLPEQYQDVNVEGTSVLLEEAVLAGVNKFVLCSSAAIYGAQVAPRVSETDLPAPTTLYAQTKLFAEQILRDVARSRRDFRACSLRCFNPIGAHPSGLIGNHGKKQTFDLLSNVLRARQNRSAVNIFGTDYDTPDRSAIRDFIHVMDVADGCAAALAFLAKQADADLDNAWTFNLGTGRGCSVLHLIDTVEMVGAKQIRRQARARRAGDIPISVADPTFSASMLNWKARRSLEEACVDALRSFERNLSR